MAAASRALLLEVRSVCFALNTLLDSVSLQTDIIQHIVTPFPGPEACAIALASTMALA